MDDFTKNGAYMMYDYTSRLTILLWFYDDCTL